MGKMAKAQKEETDKNLVIKRLNELVKAKMEEGRRRKEVWRRREFSVQRGRGI
jgi:hypothetical protein